jgi:hypothetical protein
VLYLKIVPVWFQYKVKLIPGDTKKGILTWVSRSKKIVPFRNLTGYHQ